jgi:hypothetical protein
LMVMILIFGFFEEVGSSISSWCFFIIECLDLTGYAPLCGAFLHSVT